MTEKKRQITRNRTSYSCQKCRQRKVKCDKVHPVCGACQKNDEECVYATSEQNQVFDDDSHLIESGSGKKRKYSSTTFPRGEDGPAAEGINLENQISQLSTLLKQLGGILGTEPSGLNEELEGRVLAPNVGNARSELLTLESQRAKQGASTAQPHIEWTRQPPNTDTGLTPDLDSQHGTTRSIPNAVLTQLERLNSILRSRYTDRVDEALHRRTNTRSFLDGLEDEDAPFGIPTEEQRNVLFRSWLSCVYPVLPIIDPVEAMLKYRELHFWYSYGLEKGNPNPVEDYVPVIFAIYYAGAVSISVRAVRKWFPGITRRRFLGMLKKQCLRSLKSPSKLAPGTAVLAARVMMCYMCPEYNTEPVVTSSTAPLIRMAYSCNIHREKSNESLDPALAELRRRLYWETFNIDTIEATGSNMPPSTNNFYCDTLMLSEMKDSKLDTTEADEYMSAVEDGGPLNIADEPFSGDRSSLVSGIYLFLKVKTILACQARKLLNINLAAKPKTKEDMAQMMTVLDEADRLLNITLGRFPTKGVPELDFSPVIGKPGQSFSMDYGAVFAENLVSNEIDFMCDLASSSEKWQMPYVLGYRQSVASFYKWARIVLSMLLDQSHCFSYAPFLRNVKSKIWLQARQCALKHSHSCLRKFNSLALDLELERFRWTWPRMFQPIHAAMIVLIDSYERPHSREAPRSRALFDQALALSEPEYGIVGGPDGITDLKPFLESGPEAYTMLLQLRAKAWQKAGLDSNYLWTEEDQIRVGVATPLDEAENVIQSIREDRNPDRIPNGPSGQHQQPSAQVLAQKFHQSIGEIGQMRRYPDEEIISQDVVGAPDVSYAFLERNHTAGQQYIHSQPQRLFRGRSDQARAPGSNPSEQTPPTSQTGYHYKFRAPSDLYDMHELIRKIKDVQNSTRNTNQATIGTGYNGMSSLPSNQQSPSMNMNTTPFLADNFDDTNNENPMPNGSTAQSSRSHTNTTAVTTVPISKSTSTSTSTSNTHDSTSCLFSTTENGPNTNGCQPKFDSSTVITTTTSVNTDRNETTKPPIQPPLDFDWEKWDEVFGHLMDGSYDDEDVDMTAYADTNTTSHDESHTHNHKQDHHHNPTTTNSCTNPDMCFP